MLSIVLKPSPSLNLSDNSAASSPSFCTTENLSYSVGSGVSNCPSSVENISPTGSFNPALAIFNSISASSSFIFSISADGTPNATSLSKICSLVNFCATPVVKTAFAKSPTSVPRLLFTIPKIVVSTIA